MGEGFVLLLGEIDLSMGYVGAIGGIVAANMVQPGNNFPWWLAIIAGLAVCAAIGQEEIAEALGLAVCNLVAVALVHLFVKEGFGVGEADDIDAVRGELIRRSLES